MNRLTEDPSHTLYATVDSATDSMNLALDQSWGVPVMSDQDVKVALIMAHRALMYQTMLNADLIVRVNKLEETTKKKFFRRK